MFTGIVEDLGTVVRVEPLSAGRRLTLTTRLPAEDFPLGASICINGACMTVVDFRETRFCVDVSLESLRRTTLGDLKQDDRVNLERSVRLQDRLGGHLVSGHVDGIGQVISIVDEGESSVFRFQLPAGMGRLTVEKGSIALDGISLTCFHCIDDRVEVAVIPHTRQVTTLGLKKPGDSVNVELDLLGKYVERLLAPHIEASSG
jgi:riboflavin synthase